MTKMDRKTVLDTGMESGDNDHRKKVRLVVGKSDQSKKVRCKKCGRLLYKQLVKSPVTGIEIKCGKCGAIVVL